MWRDPRAGERKAVKRRVHKLDKGRTKLYFGDCLDVLRHIKSSSVDTVLADPPYGIKYHNRNGQRIINDERSFIWWLYDAFRITKEEGSLMCFCRWDVEQNFRVAIELAGFIVRSQVIWDRQIHGMGDVNRAFAPRHDIILFATKRDFVFPASRPASVIACCRPTGTRLHPTEKPVSLMVQLLRPVTSAGGLVVDPFMGSGSSALACRELNLRFVGIEKDLRFFRTARDRLRTGMC